MTALELLLEAKGLFEKDCIWVGSPEWVWLLRVEHFLWRQDHPTEPFPDDARADEATL